MSVKFILFTAIALPLFAASVTESALAQKKVGSSTYADAYTSDILNRKAGEVLDRILGVENGQYKIRVKADGRKELVKFSKELDELERAPVQVMEVTQDETEKAHRQVLEFGGKTWLLKVTTDRDAQMNVFSLVELDGNGNEVGTKRDLGKVSGQDFYIVAENAKLRHRISKDGSKVLIYYQLPLTRDEKRENTIRYRFLALDAAANIEWQIDQSGKDCDSWFNYFNGVQIRNDGTVFFLMQTENAKDEGGRGVNLYCLRDGKAETIAASNDVMTSFTSWADDRGFHVVYTMGTRAHNFMGMGKSNKSPGLVALSWTGEQGKAVKRVDLPFTTEHAVKNQPDKEVKEFSKPDKDGKVWIPYATMGGCTALPDGGQIVFVPEEYTLSNTNSNTGVTSTTFYNQDIHIFGLDAEFNLQWSTIVPLNQMSKDNTTHGFVQTVVGDKLHILFNDNLDNLGNWDVSKPLARYGGDAAPVGIVTIDLKDPNAKQNREKLWMSQSVGGNMIPYFFSSIKDEPSAMFYVLSGKLKYSLVRVDFR
jgi:hypothetical protein